MFKKLSLLLAAGLLTGLHSIHAQETLFRQVADTKTDTHVEAIGLFSSPSLGGYHPVRVVISNNQARPHSVALDFTDATSYDDSLSSSSSFRFTAEPGTTVTHDILVPLCAQNGVMNYNSFVVKLKGSMGETQNNSSSVFTAEQPQVLLSNTLYTPNASALDTAVSAHTGSTSYGSSDEFSSRFDPKQLPDDWRAFSGFDTLILTDTDWALIPPGPRNAIISWLRLGGHLVLYTTTSVTRPAIGIPEDLSFGQVDIQPISQDLRLKAKKTVALVFDKRESNSRIDSVSKDFKRSWPIQDAFGEKSFNYVLFILILIAFGIIVGPVNLFVFAKSGRRHRLFFTTPLISIITSILLIVLIIFQDGFGGEGTRIVLMEVRPDENQNAAFIHQEQFSRTGVMASSGFTIDTPVLIVPVPIDSSRWARFTDNYSTRGNFDLQPDGGKLFASGSWFQSRSEQGQLITAVVPTRGRIEATARPGVLVSTFDFPLETLLYRDSSGQWHRAENVTKGHEIKLSPVDPTMILPTLNEYSARFTKRNRSYFTKIQDRSDHFIALSSSAPAIETHPGIDWKTSTIITGPIAR
ncbi:hypothetical protein ACFSSA_06390 [Luteolibacter algae]|uniref:Calx-beta domain-containing protein n=1 Tax=Luteolibacter algae TaxID=454151 RepID=A0ABW5D687_9BACT